MAVQDTEKNIPKGFTAADLGQAMVSSDKRFSLISYLTDPIPVGSLVNYVVFVEDATVANSCDRYEWSVSENTGDGLKQLQSETTDVGLFECRAPTVGQLSVTVNVLNPSGTNIQTLALQQAVQPRNPDLEDLLAGESALSALGGHPTTSREVINELGQYIIEAVYAPYRNQFLEIPDLLLAAEVYKETLWRPKEFEFWRDYLTYAYELRRDIELGLAADELNGRPLSTVRVQLDNSLGVCQIQPQTIAMVLKRPGLDTTYTNWLEKPLEESKRPAVEVKKLTNFMSLPAADKIDIFNLLRFPKTNVFLCCLLLERLRKRDKRWPSLSKKALLEDEKAVKIIATEYNMGAIDSLRDTAKPSSYGTEVFELLSAPFLKLVRYRFKSYQGKRFTVNNANAIVRNDDLSPRNYQIGDTIPAGKRVGDPITIPDGSSIFIKRISDDVKYVLADGFGLTATTNIKEPLFNETTDVTKPTYLSAAAANRTVGDANAIIRTPAQNYPELQPRGVIPSGTLVTRIQTAQDAAGKTYAQVSVDGVMLGWTAIGNLSSQPDASNRYQVIDPDARLRTREYGNTSQTLDQGIFIIVKQESTDTVPAGQYVLVAYTKAGAGGTYVEDTAKAQVWTSPANLVNGWADFQGHNAAWRAGNYIGQIDVVSIVGRSKGLEPQIDSIAGEAVAPYQRLVRAAAKDGLQVILTSGFRTYAQQQELWNNNPNPKQVAPPGRSNHQNGVALDLNTDGFDTPLYNWLKDHAPSYGFLRTVDEEHWHWEFWPQGAAKYGYKLQDVNP